MPILSVLRLALRRLAKAPAFTGLAILTLAPGIGAQIAIFSLVDVLFLRPLPLLREPGRVVGIYETRDGAGFSPLALPDFLDYRQASTVFSALASHYPTAPLSLGTDGTEINGSVVSADYFSTLGIEPGRGRFFLPEEDRPGASPVVVVSHALWRTRFRGRDIVGQVLRLNDTAFTVVGVAPAGFDGVLLGIPSDVWLPNAQAAVGYRWCDTRSRDCTWTGMIGRLKPGRTLREAQAEMDVLSSGLRAAHPATNAGRGLRVTPLRGVHPAARPDTLRLAGLLLAGVTLVLVVAGANLGSLLLLRSLARRKETAVRLALGATRRQAVAESVAEALLLALLGGAAGVVTASWFARVIVLLYPSDVPLDLRLDARVLGGALLLSLVSGLIIGLVPALQTARPDLVTALKEGAAAARPGRPRLVGLLGLLIIVQVALSFVLVTSTGLLARSLLQMARGGGIDPHGVVTLRLRPLLIDASPNRGQAFSREALHRLAALPGVRSVSLGVVLPPYPSGEPVPVGLPGAAPARPRDAQTARAGRIAPRYFATFGVPLLGGRDFDAHDTAGAAPVAIVDQTLARRLWPRGQAIGQPLLVAGERYQVVGLVPDLGVRNATEPPAGQVYLPYWQDPELVDARLCLRADGDPARLLPALRRELRAIDPDVPVTEVEALTVTLDRSTAPARVSGTVLGAAAGLALFLSAIGLYGVLALAVAQRNREIGIRMALGASRRQAVALVVRDAAILVAVALAVGLAAALGAGRLLAHDLYGVGPRDPLTFLAALALLTATAALASWVPARRASRVNPLEAIRQG
jgi:predicted permease